MATLELNYSQQVVDNLYNLEHENQPGGLSTLLDAMLEFQYTLNNNYFYFSDWNFDGEVLEIYYPDQSVEYFYGVVLDNPSASSGYGDAQAYEFVSPGFAYVLAEGFLEYFYETDGDFLRLSPNFYNLSYYQLFTDLPSNDTDPLLGNVGAGITGNFQILNDGTISGSLSQINQVAEFFLDYTVWEGDFEISGNFETIGAGLGNSQVAGFLYSSEQVFTDGSYALFDSDPGGIYLQNNQDLEDIFEDGSNFPENDTFSFYLPDDVPSDIQVATGSGHDAVHVEGAVNSFILNTGSGNDSVTKDTLGHIISGGEGHDVVSYEGNYSDYSLEYDNGNWLLFAKDQPARIDELTEIEALEFSDRLMPLVEPAQSGLSNNTETAIQQIFVGLLGRPVKETGETYWKTQVEADNGFGLTELMANIVNEQPEYINAFTGLSREDAVTLHFNYLFSRAPNFDQEGNNYWVNGGGDTIPTNELVLALLQGAQEDDIQSLSNKMYVADYISDTQPALASPEGLQVLGMVNSNIDSVVSALSEVDMFA